METTYFTPCEHVKHYFSRSVNMVFTYRDRLSYYQFVNLGGLAHPDAERVGELSRVCPVYPVEGEAEFITKGVCDFQRYSALGAFVLRPSIRLAIDPTANLGRRQVQRLTGRF
jgi:hypothetical protein